MRETLLQRIRQCSALPTLPSIAMEVLDLAQKEQVDIAEIARLISKDAALSSKILRTVNSSFYGRSQTVSTISHALVILGLQSVKTLVLGFSLVGNLSRNRSRGFSHLTFWRRSIYAATAARTLAARLGVAQVEECFLAALLMDIGMLVLDQVLGEGYGQVCEQARSHEYLAGTEKSLLGLTHAEVSGVLAEQWRLPPVLAVPMGMHHSPDAAPDPATAQLAGIVSVSSRIADIFVDEAAAEPIAAVRGICRERHGMDETQCDEMLDEICALTKEAAPLFDVSIAAGTNYEAILKKANEALVDLTLRTQQQAATLQVINEKLQEQATTDALTGLANRAAFDRFLAERFAAARSAQKPLALLLIDVDRFKSINDRFGHLCGDQVLRRLGRLLKGTARAQDMAARYGGEELTMVLPATSRPTAAAIAESIRAAVAARPLTIDGHTVTVTVSIGVAAWEPGMPLMAPEHLVKAADLALYAAKNGGRNRVKVFGMKPAATTAA